MDRMRKSKFSEARSPRVPLSAAPGDNATTSLGVMPRKQRNMED